MGQISKVTLAADVRVLSHPVPSVKLQAAVGEDDAAKWVMVAREGVFLGYNQGESPFQFTRATLDQLVANVQSHPSFKLGADGVGAENVIPWDFDHASEMSPVDGSKPASGAPAQAWTLDMQVREPEGGGAAELWALTRFLDPARGYVKAGQYQWASVAVHFDSIDAVTGTNVGAVISSIALTNTPFIEGMQKLVASKNGAEVTARMYYAEASMNPMHAVSQMKELFGLKETDGMAEVLGELSKVGAMVQSGETPVGVDVEHLVSSLRRILNLPALIPETEVVVTALGQMQTLLETTPQDLVSTTGDLNAGTLTAAKENQTMDELIKLLAKRLGVRETEQSVIAALDVLLDTRSSIVATLKLSADAGQHVICSATEDASKARASLEGIFAALGVEDASGSVDRIASLMKQASELEAAMPELTALRDEKVKTEEKEAEADVDQAIAASKLPASTRQALLNIRKEQGHTEFVAQFPTAAAPTAAARLSQPLATTPSGTPIATPAIGATLSATSPAPAQPVTPLAGGDAPVDVSGYPGTNAMAKVLSYLAATMSGFKDMSYDDQFTLAMNHKRQGRVICVSA